jgi:hypothetical protein
MHNKYGKESEQIEPNTKGNQLPILTAGRKRKHPE